jgi:hypothetical protein
LQLLGLPKPEFTIGPPALDLGVIQSTAGEVGSRGITLSHSGRRGYLYGEIKFSENTSGISFPSIKYQSVLSLKTFEEEKQHLIKLIRDAEARKDEKAFLELENKLKRLEKSRFQEGLQGITTNIEDFIKVTLWPGESLEFYLIIDIENWKLREN